MSKVNVIVNYNQVVSVYFDSNKGTYFKAYSDDQ